jgi:methylated-DNA-protein-cysteine methyltransferase-like protein
MTPTNYQRIWDIVAQIPHGRVATYGQVARLAGLGQRARLVGYALHHTPVEIELAWHRVINAHGKISFPQSSNRYHRQQEKLEAEGIVFKNGRVDLDSYRWRSSTEEFPDEYFAHE